MSLEQVEEMIALAKSKGVFFMEAIWSRTFPIYEKLQTILRNGCIGEVKHVITTFGQANNHLHGCRLAQKETGGGTILGKIICVRENKYNFWASLDKQLSNFMETILCFR